METSLFKQWVDKFFKPIALKIVEKINGTKLAQTYLFKSMLRKEYSPTLKWGSISAEGSTVAADVVSMDSPLPLKKRDSITKADGDVPKLGMKLALNERTMSDLEILRSVGGQDSQIIQKLFADTKKVIEGVYERLEFMFLQALSSGVTLVEDPNNVGIGIRVDFGYKASNKFGASAVWSTTASATPITDIERVLSAARTNGDSIQFIYMDTFAWNNFKKSAEVKELFAANIGIVGSNIPVPTLAQVNETMSANYSIAIKIVDRTVKTEKNGIKTNNKPWAEGSVVFLTTEEVGTLTYGRLAEEAHPAKQVDYAKVDDYILVSKFHKVDPLKEFTSSQAMVLPVINNVDSIYLLDSKTVQA